MLLAPDRNLAPGEGVAFCGLDCHLHVTVAGVERTGLDAVTVALRFRSNAVAVPGWLRVSYPTRLDLLLPGIRTPIVQRRTTFPVPLE